MSELEGIADQLKRAYEGDAWHGPALGELLAGVTAAQAVRKPIAGAHSIWELVLHLTAWQQIVLLRLESAKIFDVTPEQDWPPVTDTTDPAWQRALAALADSNRRLQEVIVRFPAGRLEELVPGKDHNFYVMLYGVVEHDLYHAGQIALLKKLL